MTVSEQTFSDLESATRDFFSLHWKDSELGAAPAWQNWKEFLFGSVPNHQLGGCYAVFSGERLDYVGLGASRGGGLYKSHGISRRLMGHVLRSNRSRGAGWWQLRETWSGASAIYTIGFSTAEYLAPALESYLIRRLAPPKNVRV